MRREAVALCLCACLAGAAQPIWSSEIERDGTCAANLVQRAVLPKVQTRKRAPGEVRPKTEWKEPLSPAEVAEFQKDVRMPIKQWVAENPELNSDYFWKFGIKRGFPDLIVWSQVHKPEFQDYESGARLAPDAWKRLPGYLGEGRGPRVSWTIEGSTITSRHVDHPFSLGDDQYCWSFGWLKGQGLDGSLLSNKSAWEALAAQECRKIGEALAPEFSEERHTVLRHHEWLPVWGPRSQCNVAMSSPQGKLLTKLVHCTANTKNSYREHVYRKCLLGFGATEMSYCYGRACVLDGGKEIGHGPECQ